MSCLNTSAPCILVASLCFLMLPHDVGREELDGLLVVNSITNRPRHHLHRKKEVFSSNPVNIKRRKKRSLEVSAKYLRFTLHLSRTTILRGH